LRRRCLTMHVFRLVAVVLVGAALAAVPGCGDPREQNCRRAHAEMNQWLSAVAAPSGASGDASVRGTPIPAEPFLTQCRALPPDVGHCLVPSYWNTHRGECRQHQDRLRRIRPAL
jgi:hypothetical protein